MTIAVDLGRKATKTKQINLAQKFNCLLKLNYLQMKKFLALSLSYVVFIMLINVKMPLIDGI